MTHSHKFVLPFVQFDFGSTNQNNFHDSFMRRFSTKSLFRNSCWHFRSAIGSIGSLGQLVFSSSSFHQMIYFSKIWAKISLNHNLISIPMSDSLTRSVASWCSLPRPTLESVLLTPLKTKHSPQAHSIARMINFLHLFLSLNKMSSRVIILIRIIIKLGSDLNKLHFCIKSIFNDTTISFVKLTLCHFNRNGRNHCFQHAVIGSMFVSFRYRSSGKRQNQPRDHQAGPNSTAPPPQSTQ